MKIELSSLFSPAPGITTLRPLEERKKAVAAHDRAIHVMPGWTRDPYIMTGPDEKYYMTFTRRNEDMAGGKAGIQIYRSSDLVIWEDLGPVWQVHHSAWGHEIDAMAARGDRNPHWGDSAMIWAPEFIYQDGRWIIVATSNTGSSNLMRSKGRKFESPFEEPFGLQFGSYHDPSLFVDDDGTPWLISKCAQIRPIKKDFSCFDGQTITIGPSDRVLGHEGCCLSKIEGKYVLWGTAWSTDNMRCGTYNLYYCVADELKGPYGPRKFGGKCLGHGTPFQDKEGRWWCTAFLNGVYRSPEDVTENGVDPEIATTIVSAGVTLVPMDIQINNGEMLVKVLDPHFATPGAEEAQQFSNDH